MKADAEVGEQTRTRTRYSAHHPLLVRRSVQPHGRPLVTLHNVRSQGGVRARLPVLRYLIAHGEERLMVNRRSSRRETHLPVVYRNTQK